MFVKKTNCNKYLMSLTVQELSALRSMASWYSTVSTAVIAKYGERNDRPASDGDPAHIINTLSAVWLQTNQFKDDIRESRNAG